MFSPHTHTTSCRLCSHTHTQHRVDCVLSTLTHTTSCRLCSPPHTHTTSCRLCSPHTHTQHHVDCVLHTHTQHRVDCVLPPHTHTHTYILDGSSVFLYFCVTIYMSIVLADSTLSYSVLGVIGVFYSWPSCDNFFIRFLKAIIFHHCILASACLSS